MMRASSLPPLSRFLLLAIALVALALFVVSDTPPPAQAQSLETAVWSATLTVQDPQRGDSRVGCDNAAAVAACSTASTLTDDDFTLYDVEYHVESILSNFADHRQVRTSITFDKALPEDVLSIGKLTVDGVWYFLTDASATQSGKQLTWLNTPSTPSWSVGDTVQLQLTMPVPGDLDPEFSAASTVLTPFGPGKDNARAMAVQPDGKIVVAGERDSGSGDTDSQEFALVRYTAAGALDTSFGTGGKVATNISSTQDIAYAVAIDSNGKIVVAGQSGSNIGLARYTTDGELDTTFGTDGPDTDTDPDGHVTTDIGSGENQAFAVAIDSNGKIVVAGFADNGTDYDFAVARYTTAGVLDTTFGTDGPDTGTAPDGYVTTAIGSSRDVANAVAIDSNGNILVSGFTYNGTDYDFALARYTTAGVLDTTFGTDGPDTGTDPDGHVTTDIGSGDEYATDMAIQSNGAIVLIGHADADFAVARYLADGGLDTAFGNGGKVTTAFSNESYANDVVVLSNDKILVAGTSGAGSRRDFALARYHAEGGLDTGFGTGGKVTTDIGSGADDARAVAITPSGLILAAGFSNNGSNDDIALAAYTAYGAPAAVLDGPGWVTTTYGTNYDRAYAAAIQPDGKIVAAGYSARTLIGDFALARYRADGSPDTGFGTDGKVTTAIGSGVEIAYAVAVQSDGKIVAAGVSNSDFAIARYNPDGTLDTNFDTDGKVTTDFGTGNDLIRAMALQPDGKIVVAGEDDVVGGDIQFALVRYNANGSLDTGFGTGGKVTTDIGSGDDSAYAVAIQPDGKIVVAGESNDDFALARYNPDGLLDTNFGTSGKVTTAIGSGNDTAYAVAIQSDDKIVAVGYSHNGTDNDFALARYTTAGALDTTFGTGGKVTTDIGSDADIANDVAIDHDGKIVAVGYSHNGTDNDFAVARYTTTGALDTTFGTSGKVTTAIGSDDFANAAAIDSDGKIVAVGISNNGVDDDFAVARVIGQVISSNANLGRLSASGSTNLDGTYTALTLSPAFRSSVTRYTARVPNETIFVKLSPTVEATGKATVAVEPQEGGGLALGSREAFVLSVGSGNVFTVRVTAEDGTTKDYTVTVTRDEPPLNVRLSIKPNPSPENSRVSIRAVLSKRVDNDLSIPIRLLWGRGVENGMVVNYGTLDQGDLPGKLGIPHLTELNGTKYVAYTFPIQIRINSNSQRPTSGIYNLAVRGDGATKGESFTVRLDNSHPDWPSIPTRIPVDNPSSVKVEIGEPHTYQDGKRPRQGDDSNPWPLNGVRVCWNDETPVGSGDCGPARPTNYGYGISLPGGVSHVTVAPTLAPERSGASLEVGKVTYGTNTENVSYSTVSGGSPSGDIALNADKLTTIIRVRVSGNGPLRTITLAVQRPLGNSGGIQGQQSAPGAAGLPTAVTLSLNASAVSESVGQATLTVTLNAPAPEGGMGGFLFAGADGTASEDDDFTMPFDIFIPGGQRSATAAISITDDDVDEPDETVAISTLFDMGSAILEDKITLTITDDDTAGITLSAASPLTVVENGRATYTVVLDSQPTADVTVTPTSDDPGAATVSPASHVFTPSAWNTPATFTVSGVADTDTNDESVGISHSVASDDALYGAVVVSTVAVTVSETTTPVQENQEQGPQEKYADLITKMKEWRNDPRYVHDKAHTDRWDRTLLTFGETVADTTLTLMTAAEAQTYADRGWTRWEEVAAALRELENQAPTVASAISDATIVNESGASQLSLSGVFDDADNDSLTLTAASSDETKATVSVAADYSTLTVTAKSRGTATITVAASDGKGGTVSDVFTVTVKAAPTVASAIGDVSGMELFAAQEISLSGVFRDADGDSLTLSASSSDDMVVEATLVDEALTIFTLGEGTATITVTAQDTDGNAVSDAFDVSVGADQQQQQQQDPPPNQAPTVASAISDATIVSESGTKAVSLTGVFDDGDGDSLTVTAASSDETKATVSVASDHSSLTVTAKARGTATITVTADDGNGGTVDDTFTVTVKAAPTVASSIGDVSGLQVATTQNVSLSGVFSDADGDSLTITAASSDDAVATVTVAGGGSALTVAGVAEGTATITVTARDTDGNTVSDDFDVSVTNQAPTVSSAISDATIVNESGSHQVSLSGVFSDADGDSLTITAKSSAETVATVAVASDYSTLTVTAKARGTATITVTANDGKGGTVDDTFTVTVKAAPVVASSIADVSGLDEGSTHDVSLSGVFSDADGDALTITAISSNDAIATVTVAADQSKLALAGVAEGTATITVTARDSDGNAASDDFTVSVEPKPETSDGAPTVANPLADISLEGPPAWEKISLSGVFHDPDGDDLTITAVSSDHGVASFFVDSSTLTVLAKGTGTATITVTAEDPDGNQVSDAFEVTVTPAS